MKRQILRLPLAFFYNIIDVTGLACYLIYRKHNARFKAKDQRRKFLKKLTNMLCMPSMETRSNNQMLVRNHFLRSAVEMVFRQQIVTPQENTAVACAPHGSRGPTTIVGSCCVYRDQKRKQRETRKTCVVCGHPVCSEHSVSETMCIPCGDE